VVFQRKVQIRGINPYVKVLATQASALKPGWRKPLPVLVRINGKPSTPHRTNMMPSGDGAFYLYLNGRVRSEAGVVVGDAVQVEVMFDAAYSNGPQHPMPSWFKQALKQNLLAERNWSALPPSRKKEILRYFAGLKSNDARDRNLAKCMRVLLGAEGRFMARDWKNGV